jgi:hypothetical protein
MEDDLKILKLNISATTDRTSLNFKLKLRGPKQKSEMLEMKMTSNGRALKTRERPRNKLKIVNVNKYQPEFQANCLSLRLSGAHPSLFEMQPTLHYA